MSSALRTIERALRGRHFAPPPRLTVSQWADRFRVLPRTGRWRTDRTPYLRGIMDALSDDAIERIAFMKPTQVGGPLHVDTPVPTPSGWTTMGALSAGDTVFSEHGTPVRVTGVSPVLPDRACYLVRFADGTELVADGAHRWTVWDFGCKPPRRLVRTTDAMIAAGVRMRDRFRFAIDCTAPLALPDADLPLAPYAFGVWLGDGAAKNNRVTTHEDDAPVMAARIAAEGRHRVTVEQPAWAKGRMRELVLDRHRVAGRECCRRGHVYAEVGTYGGRTCAECGRQQAMAWKHGHAVDPVVAPESFGVALRRLGVLGRKHIPAVFLRASEAQRWTLLQGLMDTDGSVSGDRCEFSTVDAPLAADVYELLVSLGLKPTTHVQRSRRGFRGAVMSHESTLHRLSFVAYADQPVFGLFRKQERLPARDGARPSHTFRRRIVAIDPVPSVPVRCIAVDSPTHLFLAGRGMIPTHNTEVLLNALGYYAAEDPCPILLVQPTVEMAKGFSRERVDDLLSMSPRLRGLVKKSGRRSSEDTLQFKSFPGGYLAIIGANSPSGLRSRAIRVLLADELSAWPESAGDEGDPLELAERRTATFWDRKIVGTSTPTTDGFCAITRLWNDSDQRRFFVPCPHCGEFQPLRWRDGDDETLHAIEVAEPGRYRLLFERDDADEVIPESVTYVCAVHGCVIEERHKPAMLAEGEWRAFRHGRRIAGFHLNALYSPWVSWAEICSKFLKAKSSPELLKTWVNTFGGLPWKDAGDRIEPHALMARAETLEAVPDAIAGVTIGVDVQGSWLDCQLVGWGAREESWVLSRQQIDGDPESIDTWDALDAWLWRDHGAPLFGVAIDTGYLPERVWRWIDRQPAARRRLLFGTKGMPGKRPTFVTPPGATTHKKQRRPWLVSVDEGKDLLARRLRAQGGAPGIVWPGYVHFADTLDPAYFEQLTAEQVVTVYRAGRPVREWRLIPGRRNEALDTYLLALAALYARGPKLVGRLHEYVEKRRQEAAGAPESAPASTEPQESSLVRERIAARRAAPTRGGWVSGWK